MKYFLFGVQGKPLKFPFFSVKGWNSIKQPIKNYSQSHLGLNSNGFQSIFNSDDFYYRFNLFTDTINPLNYSIDSSVKSNSFELVKTLWFIDKNKKKAKGKHRINFFGILKLHQTNISINSSNKNGFYFYLRIHFFSKLIVATE